MLALIAGRGRLPEYLVETLETRPLIAALKGFAPETLQTDLEFGIETLGSLIAILVERGVTEVCFAGSIRRPPVDLEKIDAATMPLVPRMMQALQSGDDAALRLVIEIFEEAGLRVVAAHEIAPALLPEAGSETQAQPTRDEDVDVARAEATVTLMGQGDIGQACVVRYGQVLAVEAAPGTDWMLASMTHFDAKDGILYKAPKPDQDRRIDLPTIGPETIRLAAEAGLRGIVIEAGGVLVIDGEACREAADAAAMFLWVRRP